MNEWMNEKHQACRTCSGSGPQWIISASFLIDYEEDFEADDEGAAEDSDPREKKSMSPSSDTERVKDGEASEIEDDEKDGGWINTHCMRGK